MFPFHQVSKVFQVWPVSAEYKSSILILLLVGQNLGGIDQSLNSLIGIGPGVGKHYFFLWWETQLLLQQVVWSGFEFVYVDGIVHPNHCEGGRRDTLINRRFT